MLIPLYFKRMSHIAACGGKELLSASSRLAIVEACTAHNMLPKICCVRECTLDSLFGMLFVAVYFRILIFFLCVIFCVFFIVLHLCIINK